MKRLKEVNWENIGQWAVMFLLFLIVIFLPTIQKEGQKYIDPNSALSYIWDNMEKATERIDIDSTSYIYVSLLQDSQRAIQIIKFRNLVQEGDEILAKETKNGWIDSISPEQEELVKFVFENHY